MDHITLSGGQRPSPRIDRGLFATLPNELLLPIIKHLPVRDICRLRGQNRHMRKLIDTNEHFLVGDVIKKHHDRINAEHALLTDLSDCDTVEVLRRFYCYYGAVGHSMSRHAKAVAAAFRSTWDRSNRPIHRTFTPAYLLRDFSLLQRAATLHDHRLRFERVFLWLAFSTLPVMPQSEHDALRDRLDSVSSCSDLAAYPLIPSIFHTRRALFYHGMHEEIPGDYSSQNPMFHTLLGLPLLDADDSLAFCSHRFEAFLLLARIASGPSTLLQQAAVLEDIYIW
jgi:hypothetical protein